MQLQLSELIDLIVALIVAPLLWAMVSRLPDTGGGRRWLLGGYACVIIAGVFTIAEGVGGAAGEWLNLAEHATILVMGACFLMCAVRIRGTLVPGSRRSG